MKLKKNLNKIISVTALVAVLGSGAATAYAGTSSSHFTKEIPRAGYDTTGAQTKADSSRDGRVEIEYIQYNREIGAILAKSGGDNGTGAVEEYDIAEGEIRYLKNEITGGSQVRLKIWGNPFWTNGTEVQGWWKSN